MHMADMKDAYGSLRFSASFMLALMHSNAMLPLTVKLGDSMKTSQCHSLFDYTYSSLFHVDRSATC